MLILRYDSVEEIFIFFCTVKLCVFLNMIFYVKWFDKVKQAKNRKCLLSQWKMDLLWINEWSHKSIFTADLRQSIKKIEKSYDYLLIKMLKNSSLASNKNNEFLCKSSVDLIGLSFYKIISFFSVFSFAKINCEHCFYIRFPQNRQQREGKKKSWRRKHNKSTNTRNKAINKSIWTIE